MLERMKESSIIRRQQYRRTRLVILSYCIERERNKVIKGLDIENLSSPQNIEKTQTLEVLLMEYFYLRKCEIRDEDIG